jgi:hypothetical protein
MPQLVEVPGFGQVEFPDDMTDNQIVSAIKKNSMAPRQKGALDTIKEGIRDFAMAGVKGMASGGPLIGLLGESSTRFNEATEMAAYQAGGAVTDVASKVLPTEAAAGAGVAANVATQAIPMVVGGQLAARAFSPSLQQGAKSLMQSAIKPTIKELKTGKATRAIDTLLKEGISPTKGGVEKLRGLVDDLGNQISEAIKTSQATVSKGEVGKSLLDTFEKFKKQVNPQSDLETIKKAWLEFRNHPSLIGKQDIPVQLAQELKQGTYRRLSEKYGELGSAQTESQKALARGLKEEIAKSVPSISTMNKRESELLNALSVSERRALTEANKNPVGLAWLASSPQTWALFLADRSAAFKALVARMLYSGSEQIPSTTARIAMTPGIAVSGRPPPEDKGTLYR